MENDDAKYKALVLDSGPIIRLEGHGLSQSAERCYTVPAVVAEIRDSKAREYWETRLQDVVQEREPTKHALQAVIEFSRKTGDYQSLSHVDLQVLALAYELEGEWTDMTHVRKTPKRMVGMGKIESMGEEKDEETLEEAEAIDPSPQTPNVIPVEETQVEPTPRPPPKTWANLVNRDIGSNEVPVIIPAVDDEKVEKSVTFNVDDQEGQFSDAEESTRSSTGSFDSEAEISDEECDVYILDPEEVAEKNRKVLEQDLEAEFPSLAASSLIPYDGSDKEEDDIAENSLAANVERKEQLEQKRKEDSLKPKSNSGKLYNSFRKYGDLMKPKEHAKRPLPPKLDTTEELPVVPSPPVESNNRQSRILGGIGMSGQEGDFEDDGEGWISTTKEIKTLKATGGLGLGKDVSQGKRPTKNNGPPKSERTACATTDFAMQNVLLQMNLELISVDGMKIRKLKSWVMRCGACYKVYTNNDNTGPLGKRLFCDHCGSDMMQRVAASVDGKTGRLRLHLSKHYKHNLRGTKFSLPKPGTNDRFQGDLLLREDQMMMGAWNQKVKMRSGGKARSDAQSMFGRDIASNVGCHTSSASTDDIRVGFGRRNPNAAKGRERRGKKKKSSDRACGLRRY